MDYEKAISLIKQHVPEPEATKFCLWLEKFQITESSNTTSIGYLGSE